MRLITSLSGRLLLGSSALLYCVPAFAANTPDSKADAGEAVEVNATLSVQAPSVGASSADSKGTTSPTSTAKAPTLKAGADSSTANEPDDVMEKFGRGVVRSSTFSASPQSYAFELRLGPYFPDIDKGSSRTSQVEFFGSKNRLYIGAEFDWQFARIPYLGSVGVGAGLGYVSFSGTNKLADSEETSGDQAISQESSLSIIPMSVVAVVRLDEAARRWPVPFVPYAKLGLGFAFWSIHDGVGIARTDDNELGRGNSKGLQAALGGMFLLDFLEPSAARFLDVESGINNSYLFLEWSHSSLSKAKGMNVGDSSTWVTGITLEM